MKKIVACLLVIAMCLSSAVLAEGTWVCPGCGRENAAEDAYCGQCGTRKPSESWICPNCGRENTKKFCTGCGAPRPAKELAEEPAKVPAQTYKVGDTVTMGEYAGEPIEWQVLNVRDDGTCVLMSVKGLDTKQYHTDRSNWYANWEECTLRPWLNGAFYESAFTEAEKEMITLSNVKTEMFIWGKGYQEITERDHVYILSVEEVFQYFGVYPYVMDREPRASEALRCRPTETAVKNGALTGSNGYCYWWLRSHANATPTRNVSRVSYSGTVDTWGCDAYEREICIRPVIEVRF